MTAPSSHARGPRPGSPPPPERSVAFDLAVGLLCAAAVWAPLALGATGEWARLGLEATIALAVILWAAAGGGSAWTMTLPILLLGGILVQLVPLPDRLLTAIAPISAGAWKIALAGGAGGWGRISIDPTATAMAARRLFLGAALLAAVADLARYRRYRIWLTTAISTAAVLIITAGLLFPVGRDQRIMLGFVDLKGPIEWWRTPLAPPVQSGGWAYVENVCAGGQCYQSDLRLVGAAYGSYICCNKFAGAVCLTLPVALAAFLFWTRQRLPAVIRYATTLAAFGGALWIVGVTIDSRAGFASLLAGALVLYTLAFENRWLRMTAGIVTACYAVFLLTFAVILIGQFQSVTGLFSGPLHAKVVALLADGRAVAASVAMRMFRASPILGTGLATYEHLWLKMVPGIHTWYYAHNDYAQFMAETGIAGLAVLLAWAVWVGRRCVGFINTASFPDRILDAGPWAALASIAVHSVFDWNLHIPANAFLACVICGLAVASGSPVASRATAGRRTGMRRIAAAALVGVCVVASVLLARDAWTTATERRVREALVADRLAASDPKRPSASPELLDAVTAADAALRWAPNDSHMHVLLAQTYVHLAARSANHDAAVSKPAAEYLELARLQSQAAITACPLVRGIPEPANQETSSR